MPIVVQSFFVPGPLPGLNDMLAAKRVRYRRSRHDGYSRLKNEIEEQIAGIIRYEARLSPIRQHLPVEIEFTWRERHGRRDPDNIRAGAKFILDALVRTGILPDDSQRVIAGLRDIFTRISPGQTAGVVVTIRAGGCAR